MKWMINNKWKIVIIILGIVLTIAARGYAVSRRLSMGLDPSWGSEYFILPFMLMIHLTVKADWIID